MSLSYPELLAPILISLIQLSLLPSARARAEPLLSPPRPSSAAVRPFPSARASPTMFCTSTAPPRALLEASPAGIDDPTADRHGSAARAPPLRVDTLLWSSSTQIDHGNGFLVSSTTFPTPCPALSSPLRALRAPPFTMGVRDWLLFRYTQKLRIYVRILRTRDPGNSGQLSGNSGHCVRRIWGKTRSLRWLVSDFYYFSENLHFA